MNACKVLVLVLLIAAGGGGCASSGPNTRRGAAAGAMAGGVLGGIIGNNRGSGNSASGAAIGAVVGGIAGAAIGRRTDRDRGTLDDAATTANRSFIATEPPPMPVSEPRESISTRPAREAVWIKGHWAYTGSPDNPYEWMSGHWEIPPPGNRHWVPGNWQRRGNGYVFDRGHWQ